MNQRKSITQCSDKEFEKRFKKLEQISKASKILHYKCLKCGKKFIKVDKYTWKAGCDCYEKSWRLSVG